MSIRRDYKPKAQWRSDKHRARTGALLLGALLLLTLFAGLLAYLRQTHEERLLDNPIAAATPVTATPPAAAESEQPKYTFYRDLPNREVIVVNNNPPAAARTPPAPAKPAAAPTNTPAVATSQPILISPRTAARAPAAPTPAEGEYIVQAGAFSKHEDADKVRAQLALLGIKARIEQGWIANSQGNIPVHRVRIGPLPDVTEAKALRRRLDDHKIPSITLKIND